MCEFAGFLTVGVSSLGSLKAIATRIAKAIEHRGPDNAGAWADAQAGIALGFRRLAIIDLSPAGHQPMHQALGAHPLILTGEMPCTSLSASQPDFFWVRRKRLLRAKPIKELAPSAWVVLSWNQHKIYWQNR